MSPHRLLLVESDASALSAFREILQDEGFEVVTARDAGSALEMIDMGPIDLVVSDLHLRGMSGITFLRELNRRHLAHRVVGMSTRGSDGAARHARSLGVADLLCKPLDVDDALARIRRACALVANDDGTRADGEEPGASSL